MTHFSLKNKKYLFLSIIIYILGWQILSSVINNEIMVPSIYIIIKRIIYIVRSSDFVLLLGTSLLRSCYSIIVSLIAAVILAVVSYYNRFIYNLIHPILVFAKSVPTMAFIVLLLIWVSKEYAPIIIGVIISLPIFYEVILNSLLNIDKNILKMCDVYNVSKKERLSKIILPIIIQSVNNVLNSTMSLVFKVVISSEVYSQPQYGIGTSIQFEKINLNTSGVIGWIVIILVITSVFDYCINLINKVIKEKYKC